MEKFDNEQLLEPLALYRDQLKEAFHNNAVEYFENLTKKGEVDIELNQSHCKKYYDECDIIKNLNKRRNWRRFFRVLCILLAIGGIAAGVALIVLATKGSMAMGAGIGGGVGAIVGAVLAIVGIVFLTIKIRNLKKEIDEHQAKADKHKADAYETMKKLNSLYDWNMAAGLMSKTTPLIQLDPVFDPAKYQYLHDKYGYNYYTKGDISTIYVQSGSILGNPFVFEKNYCQSMRDHVYEGTLTITYTVTVSDGKGGTRRETRTQVLVAHYTAPEPYYYLDTWLIYGNDAAPNLSFSRYPTDVNNMNEKQIERYIKQFDKKLDKEVKKDLLKDDGSFTRLHNEEFEALFNALDRDNEVEFRILFTPLGQKNMISLLRGKDVGFGDDFIFKKRKELNYIKTGHMQGSDSLDKNPNAFIHFDYKVAKELFINYCDKYLKDVFFDLAPVISIPIYQQHKSLDYIYEKGFNRSVTDAEIESAANSHDINLFKHPATYSTGVILKNHFDFESEDSDVCTIQAYSFSGTDRVAYVPVLGGDGHMHNVPVHWIEYNPIRKDTPFVVRDTKGDKSEYEQGNSEGKFNNTINRFGNSSAILFKKRLMSFVPKNK
jgi:hypothetical protein